MILSMSAQAWLFLYTVGAGAGIGVFFDVFRILRKTVKHNTLAVWLEDLFFWVATTLGLFAFMLTVNHGEMRVFALLGFALGAVLYFATLSRLLIMVVVAVIEYLKKVIAAALRIIFLPISFVWGKIWPPVKQVLRRLRRYGKIRLRKFLRGWSIVRKKV